MGSTSNLEEILPSYALPKIFEDTDQNNFVSGEHNLIASQMVVTASVVTWILCEGSLFDHPT